MCTFLFHSVTFLLGYIIDLITIFIVQYFCYFVKISTLVEGKHFLSSNLMDGIVGGDKSFT